MKPNRLAIAALCLPWILTSCQKDDPSPIAPVNQSGKGRLFRPDGKPAAYATVRIFRVNTIPQAEAVAKGSAGSGVSDAADAVLVTRTDADGVYAAENLANGEYNILSNLDGEFAYQDSMALGTDTGPLPPDTLAAPGIIRGRVTVQPQHNPQTVTVQLLGTNRFVNVGEDGSFEFNDLGEGAYSARLACTLPEYTPTFTSFTALSGKTTELNTPLKPIFTGIPAVGGLKVVYDTLNGTAKVSWNRSAYPQILDYKVYRDPSPGFYLEDIKDTSFIDPIFSTSQGDGPGPLRPYHDTAAYTVTYRVSVRTKTLVQGPVFEYVSTRAVSPWWVTPQLSLLAGGEANPTTTINDSIPVKATFRNPGRRVTAVKWYYEEGGSAFLENVVDATTGVLRHTHVTGSLPGTSTIVVKAFDEGGRVASASTRITYINDTPKAALSASTVWIGPQDSVRLTGSATDQGRIIKREWSVGQGEPFVETGRQDTTIQLNPDRQADGSLVCTFRATDEDGNADTAIFSLQTTPWGNRKPMMGARFNASAIELGGKIYVIGGGRSDYSLLNTMEIYDPNTDQWTFGPSMFDARSRFGAAVVNGRIFVFGGDGATQKYLNESEFYDPATNTWTRGPSMQYRRSAFGTAVQNGKIIVMEGVYATYTPFLPYESFDISSMKWSTIDLASAKPRMGFSVAPLDGLLYTFGGAEPSDAYPPNSPLIADHFVFDFVSRSSERRVGTDMFGISGAYAMAGRKLLLVGAFRSPVNGSRSLFRAIDPVSGQSKTIGELVPARTNPAMVISGGKIFVFGGRDLSTGKPYQAVQALDIPSDSALSAP